MADTELANMTEETTPDGTDLLYMTDSGGTLDRKLPLESLAGEWFNTPPGGRLTLTTGTPVTTSDVTAATTLYYAPYIHDKVQMYDGTTWKSFVFSELSIAVPSTTDTNYDVFCYDNSGTPTLELTAWTNDTARATAITRQDGRYVKSGTTTRVYLGSFRTTTTSGQTEDSGARRYVWNYYNRLFRGMSVTDATANWTYATVAWRAANNDTGNRVEYIMGVEEEPLAAMVVGEFSAGSAASHQAHVGIGVDSTTADSSTSASSRGVLNQSGINMPIHANYQGFPGVGYHYLQWIEYVANTNTHTFYGSGGSMPHGMIAGLTG